MLPLAIGSVSRRSFRWYIWTLDTGSALNSVRLEKISLRSAFPKRCPYRVILFLFVCSEYTHLNESNMLSSYARCLLHLTLNLSSIPPRPNLNRPYESEAEWKILEGMKSKKIQCWVVRPEWYRLLHVSSSGMQEIRTAKAVHTKRRAVYAAVKGGHLLPSCACFPLSTIEQIRNRQKRRWKFAFHEGFEFRNYGRICYSPWKQQLQSTFVIHSATKMLFILSC